MVQLANADNTADTAKPVSTAQQTALDLKANLASPTFTGTVVGITKSMVGLGSVDNTTDIAKPVSTAQQTAIDLKANLASPTFTGTVTVPSTSITSGTVTTSTTTGALVVSGGVGIGGNLYVNGTVVGITKSMVGLGSVDNTADTAKPVSTAQQTALDLKANLASPTFTGTVSGITKTMVQLGSVDNTADTAKPVSTAQQTALNLKADLASPTFTGTVSGITKTMVGLGSVDNTTDTAKPVSTAQQTAIDLKADLASPTFTGTVTVPSTSITSGTVTTSTTTGALQVTGGVGIGGNVFIGGNTRIYGGLTVDGSFNVTGSIISTTLKETIRMSERVDISNSGTGPGLTVRQYGAAAIAEFYDDNTSIMQIKDGGDVSMNKQLFVGGITSIKNTTVATSTASGALQVSGGAGIGGNLYVGGTTVGITKSMVQLGSVDNTADTAKPVSTAQQTALDLKANLASPTFTGTVSGITKSMVGLTNVDNTADTAKPVSTAQQTALDLKANLASPTFTGTVTAPTTSITNTTVSTSNTTGALKVTGGAGIGGNVFIGGNAVVGGNLFVSGTTASLPTSCITSSNIVDGTIVDGDINASAAIAQSKISGLTASLAGMIDTTTSQSITAGTKTFATGTTLTIASGATLSVLGTVSLPASCITSSNIVDGAIVDGDINVSAAIAQSKISGLTTDLSNKIDTTTNQSITGTSVKTFATGTTLAISSGATLSVLGTQTISNSTASTSTGTGALIVSGGAGIGGNIYVGGNIIMTNTNNNSTRFGYLALNANTGSSNTGFGASALTTNSGNNNTAIGSSALTANTGSSNTGVGYFAGGSISTGINNTVIGSSAGGANLTTSGNITLLGANTNLSATTWTGSTAIGHDSRITASNQIVLGTASEYVSITGTTASTSNSTGALIVSGGAGIGGNVYVGGAIKISSTTVSGTPELMVAVGYDSTNTNTIFTSTDGTNWTGMGYYNSLTGLKRNGAYWLVISINTNKILKSYDGVTWTPNTTVPWDYVYYIEWNSNNSFWYVYGSSTNNNAVGVYNSSDGVTWTTQTYLGMASITGMAYSPSIPLMVIGYGTVFYYSTNGTSSWSAGGGNMGGSTTGIKWFNDKFISYSNSQPQYSTNGSTWTNITWIGTAYTFNDVHWNGSLWMATLAGSGIATSSNGITWTRVFSTITTFTAITWWSTDSLWIAGTSATSHYRSWDSGVTWNGPHTGNMTQVKAIATSPSTSTTLPTQSTNTSTGALVVTGGAGIGGNLNVGGAALFTNTTASSTTQSGALQVRGGAGFGKAIYAPAFTVSSDSRIKKNITDMSGQSSLESLRNLKPSEYSLINNPEQSKVYGLIAQEVKQNIPEAVSIGTDFVPSIYEMAFINDDKTTVTLINKTTDVSWNRIKISDEHYDVADIIDDKTFRIKMEIPKDKIELVDVSGTKLTLNQGVYRYKDTNEIYTGIVNNGVFVYGPEVPDFHSLNMDVIWTVTTRATQELDRQLQEARQTIRNQDVCILKLEQEITLIKEHLHM
jgi:hypothetical protein